MIFFLVFYILVIPISVLLHEIGHAIGVLLSSNSNAIVFLGPNDRSNRESFKLGRIRFHIKWAYFGSIRTVEYPLSYRQQIIVAAGGPILSFILATLTIILSFSQLMDGSMRNFVAAISLFNFYLFFMTIIPIRYPNWMKSYAGLPSDGLRIINAIKGNKATPI
ncbi:hypothetical protein [Pseudalkalibacillus berkeleyi]|uniref:Peptidase M50 domain-containing protein n=1 Tax=Pseudalkalibacillus berkeleyi TaxID=1069813 RepID=A0ABS9H2Y5_9BACL|nr:hypothetical protein [Pseudalkalibacillus berkeleyi]MCF6138291.1 hypothetical protein [Pseudalkalibacillus berkeleyi]